MAIAIVPTTWKPDHSVYSCFVWFSNGWDKMAANCHDLKLFRFQISDPIWNSDHLQPNLFLNNLKTSPDFRSPLYLVKN